PCARCVHPSLSGPVMRSRTCRGRAGMRAAGAPHATRARVDSAARARRFAGRTGGFMKRATRLIPSITLGVVLVGAMTPAWAEPGRVPGQAVEARLAKHVTPAVRSDVMVFGTAHLRAFEDKLEPRHVEQT